MALCLIVKGTDEEAEVLSRCLAKTSPEVDGIFITITQPNEKVKEVAELFGANISYFDWCNDFAKARNYNFSQVPKDYDYIFWLDADDVPRGIDKLRSTIEANPSDVYSMFYLYAFDEHNNPTVVHHKTRIIKNDGCVEWAGKLHEDFKENRKLTRFHIEGIDILHLSNTERFDSAKLRNYEIAKEQLTLLPNDPRSYWNVGNASFAVGKLDESIFTLNKFLELSKSDEEKYIARQRLADCYWSKGELNKALDECRYAIGTKPEYPDAYHLAGKFYYELNRFEDAKNMFLNGLGRPAPYYQIMVYNPRDYDYTPLLWLAKTYYALNLPQLALPALEAAVKIVPADEALLKTIEVLKKESAEGDEVMALCEKLKDIEDDKELKKELDKVPSKFRYHPGVLRIRNTRFIKQESSGKDLVIFCGFTEEQWTPESIKVKGSGGSEEAAITLAEGLSKRGWNVTVFNNCGTEEHKSGKVIYKPYLAWNYRDKQDVTILWRNTKPLDWEINSKVYVDMHDVIPSGEFNEERISKFEKVFFKSKYHRSLYPQIPDEKTMVIPNGIDPKLFTGKGKKEKLIINTSSPVRSLSALCDIVMEVRKEVPDIKVKWAYGWITTDAGMKNELGYKEWKTEILRKMEEAGVEDVGRLNPSQVTDLYNEGSIFLYPTGFPEIDCISLTKALAAKCYPITTDYAALGEKPGEKVEWKFSEDRFASWDMSIDDPDKKKEFIKKTIEQLTNPKQIDFNSKEYDWNEILNQWDKVLNG